MANDPSTYLLTGGTGFIGSHLSHRLLSMGCRVVLDVRKGHNKRQLQSLGILHDVEMSESNGTIAEMAQCLDHYQPSAVIHLASCFLGEHRSDQVSELLTSNICYGTHILQAMADVGVRHFLNTGTSWQHYENAAYNPVNLYAATKQAFADIVEYYVQAAGMHAVHLELSDTYGPLDPRRKLIPLLLETERTGKTLNMSGGEQLIDLVHIDDIVDAFVIALQRLTDTPENAEQSNDTYVVSSHSAIPLRQLLSAFEAARGTSLNICFGKRPYRKREVFAPFTNGTALPGWSPKRSLADGLRLLPTANA